MKESQIKKWGKTFEIFCAEIKAQFQPKLMTDVHAMKEHPVHTSSLLDKIFYLLQQLEANQKHWLVIRKGLGYTQLLERELKMYILQVRYVGGKCLSL